MGRKVVGGHALSLAIECLLGLLKLFDVGPLFLLRHAIVPFSSNSNDVRGAHVRELLLDLDALALNEDIISVPGPFEHEGYLILILGLGDERLADKSLRLFLT